MKLGPKEEELRRRREEKFVRRTKVIGRRELAVAAEVVERLPVEVVRPRKTGVVKGRRGRPKEVEGGERLHIVLPADQIGRIDAWAGARGVSRTAAIRALIERGLGDE